MGFLLGWTVGFNGFQSYSEQYTHAQRPGYNQDATGRVAGWLSELPEEFGVAFPHLL